MMFSGLAFLLFTLPLFVTAKEWIDSFEQDGFERGVGTLVGNNVPGPMSYTGLGYYKSGQLGRGSELNGGGWVGAVANAQPTWKLKNGGRFKQASVEYACFSSLLPVQTAVPCTITATGKKANGATVMHIMEFGVDAIVGQRFAGTVFPSSFADVTEIKFSTVSKDLLGLTSAIPQFDYNVYEVL
ncbi:hypothetical protein ABW19_dt0209700 [Dactylella cylindrospora]|nr:hypothetical protein ABW19_dt0209700 [Dactylella cylindrospora]